MCCMFTRCNYFFFFSSRRRHTRYWRDWSSDVCSSDLYNLRIWRPGIWSLNPYFNNQNPMFISQGNSDLKSEKSHFFQFSYSSFGPKLNINLSLNHSFNNNGIQNVTRLITAPEGEIFDNDPTHLAPRGALYSTYANIGKSRNTGLSLYFNWNLSPKTRFYLNGYGSYNDMRSPAQGLHNYGWTGSFHSGIQHTFPLKLRASLNAGGSTPYINLQGRGSGYNYYSLSLTRSRSEEHTSELQSRQYLVCRLLLEKKKHNTILLKN